MARRAATIIEAIDRASPVLGRVRAAVGLLGAAAVAVGVTQLGRRLVDGLGAAVQASARYESAATRLAVALANQGENTRENRAELLAFSRQLQTVSLATETQIVDAIAQAKALGASTDAAKRLAVAATELAGATGVDLETAFRQTIRTLGGYAGELGETVPELKTLTAEQLKAGEAARILIDKFGGAGVAGANTFAGAVNNLNSAMDQLAVSIGGPIREVGTVLLSEFLTPLVVQLTKGTEEGEGFRDAVIDIARALSVLLEPLEIAVNNIDKLIIISRQFAAGRQVVGFVAAVSALSDGLDLATPRAEAVRKALDELGESGADAADIGDDIRNTFKFSDDYLAQLDTIPDALRDQVRAWEEALEAQEAAQLSAADFAEAVLPQLIGGWEAVALAARFGGENARRLLELTGTQVEHVGDQLRTQIAGIGVAGAQQLGATLVEAAFGADVAFGEFFRKLLRDLATAIVQALILRAILSALGFGGGGRVPRYANPVSGGFITPSLQGFAAGGVVRGQGGLFVGPSVRGSGDVVPALLSPGELVLNREQQERLLEGGGGPITVELELGPNIRRLADDVSVAVRRGSARLVASELAGSSRIR